MNVSEGQDPSAITALTVAAGDDLLDVHADADHHRAVLTLVGEAAPRSVARAAVEAIDLRKHAGAHPRFGAVDVVPFVPLGSSTIDTAVRARDDFARWAADTLGLPCFLYGPERTLPEVRRGAFATLSPDTGPLVPHPTAGAVAVGARPLLVAYNLWLVESDLDRAKAIAAHLRSATVRTLGLAVGGAVQVSCNLVDPTRSGPAEAYDAVAAETEIERAELVGLIPEAVVRAIPESRWDELDLAVDRTIEARLAQRGVRPA